MPNRRIGARAAAVLVLLAALPCGCSSGEQAYAKMRERMVREDIAARRISDHRVNLNFHNLPRFMEGEIDELIDALTAWDQTRMIEGQTA